MIKNHHGNHGNRIALVLVVVLGGCAGDDPGAPVSQCGAGVEGIDCVWAVAGDFRGTGVLSVVTVPTGDRPSGDADAGFTPTSETGIIAGVVSDDPVLRAFDDKLVIINRFGGDNITLVDITTRSLIAQISTGPGTNPQDAVVVDSALHAVALAASGVLVLDIERPEQGVIETIDLSMLDPDDGRPDCNSIERIGAYLYVSCGVLDSRFKPRGPGKIAVVDSTTREVVEVLTLSTVNPVSRLQATPATGALGGDLLIATVDFAGLADNDLTRGCLERIAARDDDGTPAASRGCLVDNRVLGGYVNAYAYDPRGGGTLHLVVTEGYGPDGAIGHLIGFDIQTENLFAAPATPPGQAPVDIVRCPDGALVLADATAGGIRVYDAGAAGQGDSGEGDLTALEERTSAALDIGLPPVSRGMVCLSGFTALTSSRPE